MSKRFRITGARWCLAGMVATLTACASITGPTAYPASWASIASHPTADGCPNLAGLYSNRPSGAVPGDVGSAPSLIDVFSLMAYWSARERGQTWSVPSDAVSVSISQTPEALHVTFIGEKGERTSQPFRRLRYTRLEKRYDDLYTCHLSDGEPRLRFLAPAAQGTRGATGVYMGGSDTLVFLLKAVDDALVVQSRTESIGLSLFIVGTHYTVDSAWSRYTALSSAR